VAPDLLKGTVDIDPIPIASADSLSLDVARRLQVRQDLSNRTLGDAHRLRDLQSGAVRPSADVG
jgi:hypothetical protein